MSVPSPAEEAKPTDRDSAAQYTIDQLAAKTGVPSRTIRFYQAKGVLPPPIRRGRVAFYDDTHAERLRVVSELQDKGLRLRAIRELILTPEADSDSIQQWLGLGRRMGSLADEPVLLTEDELKELLGNAPAGTLSQLRRHGAIEPEGTGLNPRYLVRSPSLLRLAVRLEEAGISIETALHFHDILEKSMRRTADELVEYALAHLGKGFGRSARPEDVGRAVECLYPNAPGGEAVGVIFQREIQRAISEHLMRHCEDGKRGRR
ncbi:MAG TPA: MerR family transcriptional regulator [Polyangiales bacterium]|jgi:DNA-binding transcriptional MerR regulator|nr:MerR family transcriptional regulator [Polyangiales bacterium]